IPQIAKICGALSFGGTLERNRSDISALRFISRSRLELFIVRQVPIMRMHPTARLVNSLYGASRYCKSGGLHGPVSGPQGTPRADGDVPPSSLCWAAAHCPRPGMGPRCSDRNCLRMAGSVDGCRL